MPRKSSKKNKKRIEKLDITNSILPKDVIRNIILPHAYNYADIALSKELQEFLTEEDINTILHKQYYFKEEKYTENNYSVKKTLIVFKEDPEIRYIHNINDLPAIVKKFQNIEICEWYNIGNLYRDNDQPSIVKTRNGNVIKEEWITGEQYYRENPRDPVSVDYANQTCKYLRKGKIVEENCGLPKYKIEHKKYENEDDDEKYYQEEDDDFYLYDGEEEDDEDNNRTFGI